MNQLWIYLGIAVSVITIMIIAMYKAFELPADVDTDHYAATDYDQYHTIEHPFNNYN